MQQGRIVILGSNGMLGQMVLSYFEKRNFEIICFDQRFEYEKRSGYSKFLTELRGGCVINCIGKIKQKTNNAADLLSVNTILPAELRNLLHEDVVLVHPSTDCVFNGKLGSPYPANQPADAEDDYGWTKRLGEVVLQGRPNTLVIRVSIIGPDKNPAGKGLLSWVKSNAPGSSIKGFTNHLWNGITTLEWCKQVDAFLVNNKCFPYKIVQLGTFEHYSKYDMLVLFDKVYELELTITPFETQERIDRRLIPDIICRPLVEQLLELDFN